MSLPKGKTKKTEETHMKELSKKELESLVEIARKHIYPVEARGDLETRDNDSEDFLDVSVWSIKAALTAAYELGKESSQNKRSGRKISLTTADGIPESLSNLWYTGDCDIATFTDAVEDSRTGAELVRNLGRLKLFRKFTLQRETDTKIRLKGTDRMGNISYLTVTK